MDKAESLLSNDKKIWSLGKRSKLWNGKNTIPKSCIEDITIRNVSFIPYNRVDGSENCL
jgi:hypothetical protein